MASAGRAGKAEVAALAALVVAWGGSMARQGGKEEGAQLGITCT